MPPLRRARARRNALLKLLFAPLAVAAALAAAALLILCAPEALVAAVLGLFRSRED